MAEAKLGSLLMMFPFNDIIAKCDRSVRLRHFFMFLERCLPCCLSHVGVLCGYIYKNVLRRCTFIYFLIHLSLFITKLVLLEWCSPLTVGHLDFTYPVMWNWWSFSWVARGKGVFREHVNVVVPSSHYWQPDGCLVEVKSRCLLSEQSALLFLVVEGNFFLYFLNFFLWMLHGQAKIESAYRRNSQDYWAWVVTWYCLLP